MSQKIKAAINGRMAESEKCHFPSIGHWFLKNWLKISTFRQLYHSSSITTAAVCTASSHRVTEVKKGHEGRFLKTLPKKKNPLLMKPAFFFTPFLPKSLPLVPIRVRRIQSTLLYHISLRFVLISLSHLRAQIIIFPVRRQVFKVNY